MRIYKTAVMFTDAHLGKIMLCDTIQIAGKFWLVPEWMDDRVKGKTKPARIILLDSLPHQKTNAKDGPDFVLNEPIPKCVFDGQIPTETTFEFHIVEAQDIEFDTQTIS